MTKRELIEQVISAKAELPRSEVEGLVNAVFDALAGSMVRGERSNCLLTRRVSQSTFHFFFFFFTFVWFHLSLY